MLVSNLFGKCASDLRKSVAKFIKTFCAEQIEVNKDNESCYEKRKVVMTIVKKDVITSTGTLQVCADQEAGAEAAIHAIHNIYETEECEAVLLVDAENAFNSINRKGMVLKMRLIRSIEKQCFITYQSYVP